MQFFDLKVWHSAASAVEDTRLLEQPRQARGRARWRGQGGLEGFPLFGIQPEAAACSPGADGRALVLWRDESRAAGEIKAHAPGDADKARELITKARTVAAAEKYGTIERRAAEAISRLA